MQRNNAAIQLATACRRNIVTRDSLAAVGDEFLPATGGKKYISEIIKHRHWHVEVAYDREAVAAADSIGRCLTVNWANEAWARMPKFYESDELEAAEVLPELRDLLDELGFAKPATQVFTLCATHGWCLCHFWFEGDELRYSLWSEGEILPTSIIRDPTTNRPLAFRVYLRPRLPCDRSNVGIYPPQKIIKIGDPGVILVTRGDPFRSMGFGYARLEGPWDAIQKLAVESHGNNFRSGVFANVVVPPGWSPAQIQKYMEDLAKADEMHAVVAKAAVNEVSGEINEHLPAAVWNAPATGAANKSEGAFTGMSPEWARLCAVTGYSIRHFVGNPGGAEAAAGVDTDEDLETDIQEFNLYRDFVNDFVAFLQQAGVAPALPNFVTKSHWEWHRDEQRLALAQQATAEMELKEQYVEGRQSRPVGAPKINAEECMARKMHCLKRDHPAMKHDQMVAIALKECGQSRNNAGEAIDAEDLVPVLQYAGTREEFEARLNLSRPKEDIGWKSTAVQSIAYADNPGAAHDQLYVEFKGSPGRVYYYGGVPEAMFHSLEGAAHPGKWVWDTLRGKEPGPRGPGTGPAHKWQPYGVVRRRPEVWGEELPATAGPAAPGVSEWAQAPPHPSETPFLPALGEEEKRKQAKNTPPPTRRPTHVPFDYEKTITHLVEEESETGRTPHTESLLEEIKQKSGLRADDVDVDFRWRMMFTRTGEHRPTEYDKQRYETFKKGMRQRGIRTNKADVPPAAFLHPYDVAYPSRTQAARALHLSKDTLYKRLRAEHTATRENLSATGWGFHADNPYVYIENGSPRAEYVCPEAVAKLVGQKVPLGVFHNRENDADPGLPAWQVIGTYEITGWDPVAHHELAKLNYDADWEQKVRQIFQKLNEADFVTPLVKAGTHPDISTAYNCKVHYDDTKRRWIQTDFDFKSVSLVPKGNCSAPYCTTKIDAEARG